MFKKTASFLTAVLMICAIIPLSALNSSAASESEAPAAVKELSAPLGADEQPEKLVLNKITKSSVAQDGGTKLFSFVPDAEGYYSFTVNSDGFSYCVLSDGTDDYSQGGYGTNTVKCRLAKGKACSLEVSTAGEFSVLAAAAVSPSKLEIITPPDNTTYYKGALSDDIDFSGMRLQITWSDGTKTVWTYGDDKTALHGENFYYSCNGTDMVEICVGDCSAYFSVTLEDTPVKSIEITGKLPTLIKEANGYISSRYDKALNNYFDYFHYDLSELDGVAVVVNYKDGTSEESEISRYLYNPCVRVYADDDENDYVVGSNNPATLSFLGYSKTIYLTVAESPVKSLEIIDNPEITLIENYDGDIDYRYNPADYSYDIEFFRYYYSSALYNTKVRINYKDGKSKTACVYDTVDGYGITASDTQELKSWAAGGNNFITVSYAGASVNIPVTIVKNPVDYIEIPAGTSITLYENTDGYYSTDYEDKEYFNYSVPDLSGIPVVIRYTDGTVKNAHINENIGGEDVMFFDNQYDSHWTKGGKNFIDVKFYGRSTVLPVKIADSPVKSIEITSNPTRGYILGDSFFGGKEYFNPTDLTGLAFTVNYTDGTTKRFTDKSIKNGMLDGHCCTITPVNDEQILGSNSFTLEYMGKKAEFTVKVIESPVKSVKMTKLPNITAYSQYYFPDFDGAQVTVTYKDNKTKTVNLSKDNLTYRSFCGSVFSSCFDIDGITAELQERLFYDDESGAENRFFVLSLADVECEVPGMVFKEHSNAKSVEIEDYTLTGRNMLVKVTFENGSSESIRLTNTFKCGSADSHAVSDDSVNYGAFTGNGVLSYMITAAQDADPTVKVFGLLVPVDKGKYDYLTGDINGDGIINIDDATALQRYLAEYSGIDKTRVNKCGDVNRDGKISIEDVTYLQRFLAEFSGVKIG